MFQHEQKTKDIVNYSAVNKNNKKLSRKYQNTNITHSIYITLTNNRA